MSVSRPPLARGSAPRLVFTAHWPATISPALSHDPSFNFHLFVLPPSTTRLTHKLRKDLSFNALRIISSNFARHPTKNRSAMSPSACPKCGAAGSGAKTCSSCGAVSLPVFLDSLYYECLPRVRDADGCYRLAQYEYLQGVHCGR